MNENRVRPPMTGPAKFNQVRSGKQAGSFRFPLGRVVSKWWYPRSQYLAARKYGRIWPASDA